MQIRKFFKNNFHFIFIAGGIILLVVLLYYKTISDQQGQGAQEPVITSMKTFIDPADHFIISIPADWGTTTGNGGLKTGIGTAQEKIVRTEVTNIFSGNAGLNVSVYEETPDCSKILKPNTTVAGMPAYFDALHYAWVINTTNSTIVAGYYFPGAGIYHRRIRNQTPPPSSEMFANQKMVNEIISTLKLRNSQILECP